MAIEFTRCESCGIIFPNQDGKYDQCPKCRHEASPGVSIHDALRVLRNALKDMQCRGVMLTIPQLAEQTSIDEGQIWHFIHTGEIETATFSDPEVRAFIVKKKKELMKSTLKAMQDPEPKPEEPLKPKSGFHLRAPGDPDKG